MLLRLDHIDLKVPDLETTATFFKSIGLVEVRRTVADNPSVEMALPGEGQVLLEIRQDPSLSNTVVDHVAFGIDDTESTVAALKAVGVDFSREGHLVPRTGRRVSNFKDPHGGKWQLSE